MPDRAGKLKGGNSCDLRRIAMERRRARRLFCCLCQQNRRRRNRDAFAHVEDERLRSCCDIGHRRRDRHLMGWRGTLRRRRAAKAYVYKLGPWLRRAYGASRTYTAPQIERGARELNLDLRHIVFGHAVFLDPAAFAAIYGALPNPTTIDEAQAALRRELGGRPRFDAAEGGVGDAEGTPGWGLRDLFSQESGHHSGVDGGHGGGADGGH